MKQLVEEAIGELITEFRNNPADFLYESDLQAHLYGLVYKKLKSQGITVDVQDTEKSKQTRITPVKTEYPSGQRFDLALIDCESHNHFESFRKLYPSSPDKYLIWCLPVVVAVELKYCVPDYSPVMKYRKLIEDVEKMMGYADKETITKDFAGVGVLFVHPECSIDCIRDQYPESLTRRDVHVSSGVRSWVVEWNVNHAASSGDDQ